MERGQHPNPDPCAAVHGLAARHGQHLVGGHGVRGHQVGDLVVADDDRAGSVRDPIGAEDVVEVGVRDEQEVGFVDVACGQAWAGYPGGLVQVGVEEDRQPTEAHAEGRAPEPLDHRW